MNTKLLLYWLIIMLLASGCHQTRLLGKYKTYNNTSAMIEAAKKMITEISIEDFKQLYEEEMPLVIDIRTNEERDSGFIPGSFYINRGVLEFRIDDEETWDDFGRDIPTKSELIIVYCGSGSRSALATKTLMQLGYKNVMSLHGGWGDWNKTYPEIIDKAKEE